VDKKLLDIVEVNLLFFSPDNKTRIPLLYTGDKKKLIIKT